MGPDDLPMSGYTRYSGMDPTWRSGAPAPVDQESRPSMFGPVLLVGVLSVLFGISVLVWPDVTARSFAVLTGIWLMLVGAARIVNAFLPGRGIGRQVLSGIVGVVLFLIGAACVRDVAKGLAVLALAVAVTWLFSGVAWWVIAMRATGAARGWLLALAGLSVAFGIVFLVWPHLSLASLVLLTGLGALASGFAEISFAFWRRRAAP